MSAADKRAARLRTLIDSGVSAAAIAWSMGMSVADVRRAMGEATAQMRPASAAIAEPAPAPAPAPAPVPAPSSAAASRRHGWREEDVSRLRALARDGLSASKIGAEIGLSRSAVIGAARRYGICLGRAVTPRVVTPARSAPTSEAPAGPASVSLAPVSLAVARPPSAQGAGGRDDGRDDFRGGVAMPAAPAAPAPRGSGPRRIEALRLGDCRFPLWRDAHDERDGPKFYCGAPARAPGESWCAACRARVYAPRPKPPPRPRQAPGERRRAHPGGAFAWMRDE